MLASQKLPRSCSPRSCRPRRGARRRRLRRRSSAAGGGGEPASLAPPKRRSTWKRTWRRTRRRAKSSNELAQTVLGIENVGEFVAEELEEAALGEGEKFNFEEEVEPWLGEKAGMYLQATTATTSTATASRSKPRTPAKPKNSSKSGSKRSEGTGRRRRIRRRQVLRRARRRIGARRDRRLPRLRRNQGRLRRNGGNLRRRRRPERIGEVQDSDGSGAGRRASAASTSTSAALIKAGERLDPAGNRSGLRRCSGSNRRNATAVATLVPHSEQVEIDFTTNLDQGDGGRRRRLGAARIAARDRGGRLRLARIRQEPSAKASTQLERKRRSPARSNRANSKRALGTRSGSTSTRSPASIGDVGGFVEGSSEGSLGGALVIETDSASEAKNTVANIGLLLRATRTPRASPRSAANSAASRSAPPTSARSR